MSDERLLHTGVAWYQPDQWERLRESAADPEVIVDRYEDWVAQAEKMIALLEAQGMRVERVEVDIDEMTAWCEAQGRPFDSKARAEFVSEVLRRKSSAD